MDFPSENQVYNDWDDFDTASANMVGDYTLEIFAQLRNTGRILDHFRCVLGGSKHLKINASLTDMFPNECFRGWRYRTQKSPSEVVIRKNMFSSAWVETPTTLLFNEASVYNAVAQGVSNEVFMGMGTRDSGHMVMRRHWGGQEASLAVPVPANQHSGPKRKSRLQRVSWK